MWIRRGERRTGILSKEDGSEAQSRRWSYGLFKGYRVKTVWHWEGSRWKIGWDLESLAKESGVSLEVSA